MTDETKTTEAHENDHPYIFELLFEMLMEFLGMFKYLFNDMWLGKDA